MATIIYIVLTFVTIIYIVLRFPVSLIYSLKRFVNLLFNGDAKETSKLEVREYSAMGE